MDVNICVDTKTVADLHPYDDVAAAIQQGNLDSALTLWSRAAESSEKQYLANNAVSRCGGFKSVRTSLCEPRLKAGRPGDFRLPSDTPTLVCRQRLRQCRRLQTLCRLVSKDTPDHVQISCTWRAILTAPGFEPNFPEWLLTEAQVFCPFVLPEHGHLELIRNFLCQHLVALSAKVRQDCRKHFTEAVATFSAKGGRLAFAVIWDSIQMDVRELVSRVPLKLLPQHWPDLGRTVIRCSNVRDFEAGDCLGILDQQTVSVVQIRRNALVLSSPIPKSRACKLCKICAFTTPDDIAANFFQGWNSFWKRDDPLLDVPPEAEAIIQNLPSWGECPFRELSLQEWRKTLRNSKTCAS